MLLGIILMFLLANMSQKGFDLIKIFGKISNLCKSLGISLFACTVKG